jgi:hypothetical protein
MCFKAELAAGSMRTGRLFTTISCLTKTHSRSSMQDENRPKHRHSAAVRRDASDRGSFSTPIGRLRHPASSIMVGLEFRSSVDFFS